MIMTYLKGSDKGFPVVISLLAEVLKMSALNIVNLKR
jgi:hypothetical protein